MIWLPGVARQRRAVRIRLALWTAGIVLITMLPWSNFQRHAHWAQVNWVPFASPFDNARDVILNGVVFGIFGYLCTAPGSLDTGERYAAWRSSCASRASIGV